MESFECKIVEQINKILKYLLHPDTQQIVLNYYDPHYLIRYSDSKFHDRNNQFTAVIKLNFITIADSYIQPMHFINIKINGLMGKTFALRNYYSDDDFYKITNSEYYDGMECFGLDICDIHELYTELNQKIFKNLKVMRKANVWLHDFDFDSNYLFSHDYFNMDDFLESDNFLVLNKAMIDDFVIRLEQLETAVKHYIVHIQDRNKIFRKEYLESNREAFETSDYTQLKIPDYVDYLIE